MEENHIRRNENGRKLHEDVIRMKKLLTDVIRMEENYISTSSEWKKIT